MPQAGETHRCLKWRKNDKTPKNLKSLERYTDYINCSDKNGINIYFIHIKGAENMNLEYFGLTERPFLAEPFPEGFCPTGPVENARKEISRCVRRMEGISLVTGPSGCGKTLLCRVLAQDFEDELDVSVLCGKNLITPKTLFQTILAQLGISYTNRDENELRISVFDYLSLPEYSLKGLLIIVDDAHALRMRILEELRQLLDSVFSPRSGVRLMLAGLPSLEEKLTDPKLYAFSQRITTRCFLETLSRDETEELLRTRILSCGGRLSLFSSEVCREIHRLSDGIPRVVHQLADHLLLCAYEQKLEKIPQDFVQAAWNSLQQIAPLETYGESAPSWASTVEKPAGGAPVISFSTSLDDDFSETPDFEHASSEFSEDFAVSASSMNAKKDPGTPTPQRGKEKEAVKAPPGLGTVEFGTLDDDDDRGYGSVRAAVREASEICNETVTEVERDFSHENRRKTKKSPVSPPSERETASETQEMFRVLNSLVEKMKGMEGKAEKESPASGLKEKKSASRSPRPANGRVSGPQNPVKIFDADAEDHGSQPQKDKKRQLKSRKMACRRSTIPFHVRKTECCGETDTLISRMYLKNTVQSFSQLHSMLEALLREYSAGGKPLLPPSRMWMQLHSLTASVMQQLVEERFGGDECPVKLPFPSDFQAKSAGGTCPFKVGPEVFQERLRYKKRKNSRIQSLLQNILNKLSAGSPEMGETEAATENERGQEMPRPAQDAAPMRYKKAKTVEETLADIQAELQDILPTQDAVEEIMPPAEEFSVEFPDEFPAETPLNHSPAERDTYQAQTLLEDAQFASVLARLKAPGKYRLDEADVTFSGGTSLPDDFPGDFSSTFPSRFFPAESTEKTDPRILQDYLRKCKFQLDSDQDFAERFHDILSQLKTLDLEE